MLRVYSEAVDDNLVLNGIALQSPNCLFQRWSAITIVSNLTLTNRSAVEICFAFDSIQEMPRRKQSRAFTDAFHSHGGGSERNSGRGLSEAALSF